MGRDWLRGNWVLLWAIISKSLIQFSADGWGCVPSLLFNCGHTMVEVMKIVGTFFKRALLPSVPPTSSWPSPSHASAGESWTLIGKTGSVSCGVTAPFSWVLVHTGSVCALRESVFPVPGKFWWLCGGVNGYHLQEGFYHTKSTAPQSAAPLWQFTADPYLHRRHSNTVLSKSLWGLWVLVHATFVWSLWVSLVAMGFDLKINFVPSTILLGLLLCPQMWGISLKSLQHHVAASPALTILLGLLCPCTWGIASQSLQHHAAAAPENGIILVNRLFFFY